MVDAEGLARAANGARAHTRLCRTAPIRERSAHCRGRRLGGVRGGQEPPSHALKKPAMGILRGLTCRARPPSCSSAAPTRSSSPASVVFLCRPESLVCIPSAIDSVNSDRSIPKRPCSASAALRRRSVRCRKAASRSFHEARSRAYSVQGSA